MVLPNDQKCVLVDQRVAVTQFTCELTCDRDAAELFDRILGSASCIVSGTACGDNDLVDGLEIFFRPFDLVENDLAVLDTRSNGSLNGSRLLDDLLEHEVLVAAFFRSFDIPCDTGDLLGDGLAGCVKYLDLFRCQFCELTVVEVDRISCICNECGNVGSEEVLACADAQDQRARLTGNYDRVRLIRADNTQCIGTGKTRGCLDDGTAEVALVVHFDEMNDDLGICLTVEVISLADQFFTKRNIVLDDAVMNDSETAVVTEVRVGIGICRGTVGRPSGMTDTDHARAVLTVIRQFAKIRDTAADLIYLDGAFIQNGNTCGVIASVFQFLKSVQKDRSCRLRSCISNDSTHNVLPFFASGIFFPETKTGSETKPEVYCLFYFLTMMLSLSGPTETYVIGQPIAFST